MLLCKNRPKWSPNRILPNLKNIAFSVKKIAQRKKLNWRKCTQFGHNSTAMDTKP
jgi:hypothetical protein